MTSLSTVLALGCLLGMQHAMDPDHVVAVSTLVSRENTAKRALRIGAMWGLGHSLMVLLIGVLMIVGRVMISSRVSAAFEFGVAAMLVLLGVLNLRRTRKIEAAMPAHAHDQPQHFLLRSMMVGIVHGLAGSAAVALVVLTSIHDAQLALLYLALFAVGTIVGMTALTTLFSVSIAAAMKRFATLDGLLPRITGVLSIVCGLCVAYRIVG